MTTATEITEEQYTAAIERIDEAFGSVQGLVDVLEAVRDEETLHTTDNEANECVDDCVGCLTERIADAVTRAALNMP
jgi:hypothetical protein